MNVQSKTEPHISIACYKPKPEKSEALHEEVRRHHEILKNQGLVTDRRPIIMLATDGTVVEVFEWVSGEAIEKAHTNPEVLKMWERFSACCDYVPIGEVDEAKSLFSGFRPLA